MSTNGLAMMSVEEFRAGLFEKNMTARVAIQKN
jgi:hypothetical protein